MKILKGLAITLIIGISIFINNFIYAINDNYPIDENLKEQITAKTNYIEINKIPQELVGRIILAEDNKFYEHKGYSLINVAKNILNVLSVGQMPKNNKTITQQLAQNLFLSNENNKNNNLQELVLAVQLERNFTKDEILEMYLNLTNFGLGATGIQEASQTYFQKNPQDLTIAECEYLVNLLWVS